ncbi:MAG: FAD-dependent oxidoreductase [Candidatus Paceibacterota bacterium]
MNNPYDILILGGGPIAASTAYFLTQEKTADIGLLMQEPTDSHSATYQYAGGSIRWFWPDELKTEMTTQTAEFIKNLDAQGVDLSLLNDNYLFMARGKYVPSINVSGKKLVEWFLQQAQESGLAIHQKQEIISVTQQEEMWHVKTATDEYLAKKVLMALGVNNKKVIADYEVEVEKRELFVLDLPVTATEEQFPHTIIPINEGVVYIFIKKFPEGMRFVVGQEDILNSAEIEADQQFSELMAAGLGDLMPFLKEAKVEKILWGNDAGNKTLRVDQRGSLFIANCGSAIRSCVWIGKELTKRLLQ